MQNVLTSINVCFNVILLIKYWSRKNKNYFIMTLLNLTILILCFFGASTQHIISRYDFNKENASTVGELPLSNNGNRIKRTSSIANEKCQQYNKLAKELTKVKSTDNTMAEEMTEYLLPTGHYVISGKLAKPSEFPHMALIFYGDTIKDNNWRCAGSLISERWILVAAAHCKPSTLELYLRYSPRWVRLGAVTTKRNADYTQTRDYLIAQYIDYSSFKSSTSSVDLALISLEIAVEFTAYIRPICLNTNSLLKPEKFIFTFWEQTVYGLPSYTDLLKLDVNLIPLDQCNNSYAKYLSTPYLQNGLSENMICTTWIERTNNVCQLDSGGPIQIKNNDNPAAYTLIGLITFGDHCKNRLPDVYLNITPFIPWIESIVWPPECVNCDSGVYDYRQWG